jgi:hypothetical protein
MEPQMSPAVQKRSQERNRERKVLLIGASAPASSYLADRLRARGFKCELATSYEAACSLLGAQEFCVVLSPTRLRTKSLLPLMNLLEGSDVTLFYAERVEEGCWWLPALRRGVECFGSCAVRPSEFVSMLIETIDALVPLIAAQPDAVVAPSKA